MELSQETLKGLANIQNVTLFPEEIFSQVLEIVVSHICHTNTENKSIANIYNSKPDAVKRAFLDIACLFTEAARHSYSEESLDNFLRNEHINGQRVEKLCDVYAANKEKIQTQLELTGNSLPHIVDVDWRLDYCYKSGVQELIGTPIYHVRLTTKKHGELKYITFTCSVQQLQELVYKLKDAVRHVEKIANV